MGARHVFDTFWYDVLINTCHFLSFFCCSSQRWGCLLVVYRDGIDTTAKWSIFTGGWFHLPRFILPKATLGITLDSLMYNTLSNILHFYENPHLHICNSPNSISRVAMGNTSFHLRDDDVYLAEHCFWLSCWLKSGSVPMSASATAIPPNIRDHSQSTIGEGTRKWYEGR